MALNLVRNSRVFFTTNVDATTGNILATGITTSNTYEIQVLDGFTFSQNSNSDVVTISEAGTAPVRGQRSFNTSLAPVDFSFSTYARPYNNTTSITAEESVLWNALLSNTKIADSNVLSVTGVSGVTYAFNNSTGVGTVTIAGTGMANLPTVGETVVVGGIATTTASGYQDKLNTAGVVLTSTATAITIALAAPVLTTAPAGSVTPPLASISSTTLVTASTVKLYKSAWATVAATHSYVSAAGSNFNQLQKFGLIFVVDSAVWAVDNAAMGQLSIDFGLDAITTLAWTGQATALREITGTTVTSAGVFSGGLLGTAAAKNTSAQFITNKLSTMTMSLVNTIGSAAAGTSYAIAITGGNITINNNITYITPANLGIVNLPITYYTGTRAISGSINAYLKTGSGVGGTGQLLSDMLAGATTTVEPMVAMSIAIGGGSNTVKVVLDMPAATISIPTIDVQQVVSTAINFTAAGYVPNTTTDANVFALDKTSDLAVRYYA